MSAPTPLERPAPRDQATRPPPNRRRDKQQLSCDFCRQRKIRCDRCRPCAACTARGRACVFPSPPKAALKSDLTNRGRRTGHSEGSTNSSAAAVRRQQAGDEADSAFVRGSTSPPSLSGRAVSESGTMRIGAKGTVYVGSPHWEAIMDEISELRDRSGRVDESQASSNAGVEPTGLTPSGPLLLYNYTRPMTKGQLLCALPAKSVADRLVFQYFNEIVVLPLRVIHPATFLQQYEAFWADPSSVSIQWLGLLFSLMSLSVILSSKSEQASIDSSSSTRNSVSQPSFVPEMVQCLIKGDYIRGGPHIIETLIHCCMIESNRLPYSDVNSWMVSGLATQIALRMGYHRDPSHFPEISPFDGEMRRRVWTMVHMCDTTFSVVVGAPKVISEGSWDTSAPLNLHDADFGPFCTQLPSPRPDDEVTTMSFSLARYKLSILLGWLMDVSTSNRLHSAVEMQRAESRLDTTWKSIHAQFKFSSLSHCLSDSSGVIAQRLGITCLYNKLLITLHRCNLLGKTPDSSSPPSDAGTHDYEAYSRRTCIGAAVQNVEYLIWLDAEIKEGGSLSTLRNKLTVLLIHELLVATAVLGTYLYKLGGSSGVEGSKDGIDALELEAVLRRCREPWVHLSSLSDAAGRAVGMLDFLFQRLEGNLVNSQALSDFSMVLDGTGLNLAWDADVFRTFWDLTDEASM